MAETKRESEDKEFERPFPNEWLPSRSELQPVTNRLSTFGDCYFQKPFDELMFGQKLQVVADLLRQSVLPAYYSDPDTEQDKLVGDCHATSRLAISYLKYLGVGVEYDYAMVNRRPFDPPEKTYSKHAIVIVTDSEGGKWQLDSAPWMGYGYGKVCKIGDNDQVIYDYTVMTESDIEIIDEIKRLRLIARTDVPISGKSRDGYIKLLREAEDRPHLAGFVGEAYAAMCLKTDDPEQRMEYADKALCLDPFRGANKEILPFTNIPEVYFDARNSLMRYTEEQCKKWEGELNILMAEGGTTQASLQRQLELAQWIVNERKFVDTSLALNVEIGGSNIPLTAFNPRMIREMGLNVAIIKPSAYHIGASATVREKMIRCGAIVAEYDTNPVMPTNATHLEPLLFSHALAGEFEQAYTGKNTVLLVKASAEKLFHAKHYLRRTIGGRILGELVKWTDGNPVAWHPYAMNYVHTTDNPAEASVHFMFGYPEYSPMTRWMYPNPRLT